MDEPPIGVSLAPWGDGQKACVRARAGAHLRRLKLSQVVQARGDIVNDRSADSLILVRPRLLGHGQAVGERIQSLLELLAVEELLGLREKLALELVQRVTLHVGPDLGMVVRNLRRRPPCQCGSGGVTSSRHGEGTLSRRLFETASTPIMSTSSLLRYAMSPLG